MRTQRKFRVVDNDTVEHRLQTAFPEIDLVAMAQKSTTMNSHNLSEKWDATVRNVQWWIDLSNGQ